MDLIKIKFVDFFLGFIQTDNGIYTLLSKFYNLEISDEPDFVFYSCWGNTHLTYSCTKIFVTGENVRPNFFHCDYALGFDFLDRENYLRLPLYVYWKDFKPDDLVFPKYNRVIENNPKTKFCCFVVSNSVSKHRIEFFKKLTTYKQVDSGGKVLNTISGPISNKLDFMRPYRFMIAFENSSFPGYVTEKIYECFFTNTIPIYWGSDRIEADFNPQRILNRMDYESDESLIDRIIYLEKNEIAYLDFIRQPVFVNNIISTYFDVDRIRIFFDMIFSGSKETQVRGIRKQIGTLLRKKRNFEIKFLKPKFR